MNSYLILLYIIILFRFLFVNVGSCEVLCCCLAELEQRARAASCARTVVETQAMAAVVRFKLKADPTYTEVPLGEGVNRISIGKLKEAITQVKFGGNTGAFGLKLQNEQTKEGEHDVRWDARKRYK